MKIRFLTCLGVVACFAGSAGMFADEPKANAADNPKKPAATAKAKPALEKGMSGDEVVRLLGKPAEIKEIKAPEGKAESWTYRRLLKERLEQDATAVSNQPVYTGTNVNGLGAQEVPVVTLTRVQIYQVTALLMVDGKLVVARQWQEKKSNYDE